MSFILKEPIGVVGAIISWNGPLTATIWEISPALATGCTFVLKPAEEAPLTPLRLAELCQEAGVPSGVVNVVTGYGETAGAALSAHPDADEFTARVAAFSKTLRVGNSSNPDTQVGPLVSAEQFDRVTGYLAIGRQEGARPFSGGERLTNGEMAKGFLMPPTVFADVKDDTRIAQEEIFGPVISAIPFTSIDEVIERANKTSFGLGSGLWTQDVSKAHKLARGICAGSVWINCYQAMDPAVPFGGYKRSGYGSESGTQHVEEYLNLKAV